VTIRDVDQEVVRTDRLGFHRRERVMGYECDVRDVQIQDIRMSRLVYEPHGPKLFAPPREPVASIIARLPSCLSEPQTWDEVAS